MQDCEWEMKLQVRGGWGGRWGLGGWEPHEEEPGVLSQGAQTV